MMPMRLGDFVNEHIPGVLVRPETNVGKDLMGGKDDLSLVIGLFQVVGESRCHRAGNGVTMEHRVTWHSRQYRQFIANGFINQFFGGLEDDDPSSLLRPIVGSLNKGMSFS